MALAEGTYVIVNGSSPTYALDVTGGSDDQNGRRVQLYTRNNSDAQIVRVVQVSSGVYRLIFLLSGKALDRNNNGSANGTKVQQWDSYNVVQQQWRIAEDGQTVTVGGVALPTYVMRHNTANAALDITGAAITNGTPLQMYAVNGTVAQRWAFVPLPSITDGTYTIRSAMNTGIVLDVAGNSTADGANIAIYSDNGSNAQKWRVTNNADGTLSIRNAVTGKAFDVDGGATADGKNVQAWAYSATNNNQKWVAVPTGTVTIDGNIVPSYVIRAFTGVNRVLDVANGSTQLSTNVRVWTANGTKAQLFAFDPTEYLASDMPVPSKGNIAASKGGAAAAFLLAKGSIDIYPFWFCNGKSYQCRYRSRTRAAGAANTGFGAWSAWASIYDGSTANEGWGNIGSANVASAYRSGDNNWSPVPTRFNITATGTDRADYEFQVRRFQNPYGAAAAAAHGGSMARTGLKVAYKATLSGLQAVFTPEGLRIGYTSDLPRDGNTIAVTCAGWFDKQTFSGLDDTGSFVIPIAKLKKVPNEGDKLKITFQWSTYDAQQASFSSTLTVSYSGGHGSTVTANLVMNETIGTLTVDNGARAWMVIHRGHGDRFVEVPITGTTGVVIPPLGVPYKMFVSIDNGETWASKLIEYPAVDFTGYHVTTFDGSHDFGIYVGKQGGISFAPKYTGDSSVLTTTGREREVVGFGSTVAADWAIDGVLLANKYQTDLDAARDSFDYVAHQKYAIFRSPYGFWAQTAIKDAQIDLTNMRANEINLSFIEVIQ